MKEMYHWFLQLPEAASSGASNVDNLFGFIWGLSFLLGLSVVIPMLWAIWRFHGSRGHKALPTKDNHLLELTYTVLPMIPIVVMFVWGFDAFMKGTIAPENSIRVRASARQWAWSFKYPNGFTSDDELIVPVNQSVQVVLSSSDVLHSFFVPEFRVKRDAVPGMFSTTWFRATKEGTYQIYCAEYCAAPEEAEGAPVAAAPPGGVTPIRESEKGHAGMRGIVRVVSAEEYARLTTPQAIDPTPENGMRLFASKGCNSCHSIDGSRLVGPSMKGLFGRSESLADGSAVDVDENYLRESLLVPGAKVVAGYPPVMPAFKGLLSDPEVEAITEYIKTLK